MENEKFKISIIDFMPHHKEVEVGKYKDGTTAYLGDCVMYNNEKWLIVYRYGDIMLKQIGMMAMISIKGFENGDFSKVEKTNVFLSGNDWLIIGYKDEELYQTIKNLIKD